MPGGVGGPGGEKALAAEPRSRRCSGFSLRASGHAPCQAVPSVAQSPRPKAQSPKPRSLRFRRDRPV
ncbi:MAG: hypothetical protein DMF89_04355 [Acidobacteria bacterium]|nr:MAG: hypothetical protein DMF90_04435 [Acidobacteriota bacterium]PYR51958.1 MAG: hypothetical protein DMF89_04355 [Acidobacteriota bacterium]